MNHNFAKSVLAEGGSIHLLLISTADSKGPELCNPSVYIGNGEPWCILRNLNYTLYHSYGEQRFNSRWGSLAYLPLRMSQI
jgi:hypothetical protein